MWAWFNASIGSGAHSCVLYYQPSTNQVNLLNDAGTAWTAATPGATTTLQNSQCSLNVAASSVTQNGNTLTLNLAMTFKPAFSGAQERLHVRQRCVGVQQRVAATGHLDGLGRCTGGGFGDAKFRIGSEPNLRAAIFRHGRSVQPAVGMGVVQCLVDRFAPIPACCTTNPAPTR